MDGVLVVDKPEGWTSHDVVAKVRNITRVKKVGHTGTLDPFATGVLPLTLGRATRLTSYFLSSDKTYHGVIRFGFATTTFDRDGEPTGGDARPQIDSARVEEIFTHYLGTVRQTQPPYSAKKVHGKPMYQYARKGVMLNAETKEVTIKLLKLLRVQESEAEFELCCTAGTYARSLAHDVGREYGCGAHLVRLRRTRSGEFPIESATPLTEGDRFYPRDFFANRIIPMRDLLLELPAIRISSGDCDKVRHGMDLNLLTSSWDVDEYRLLDESGELIALAQRVQTFVSPVAQPVRWIRIHPRINFE
ncbi:MAG: tRNA pseudouridine(55) synthase TruB [Acidobacteriia bacterium]|nr:tRNA pseudouridine(55) synthase TruB [Terriglobia bacterium]